MEERTNQPVQIINNKSGKVNNSQNNKRKIHEKSNIDNSQLDCSQGKK